MKRLLVLSKRQYTNRDLLDDRFGRIRELPLQLALRGFQVNGLCLSYKKKKEGKMLDGPVLWESLNAGSLKLPGLLRFILRASSLASRADVIWACSDSFYGIIGYWLSRRYHVPLVFDLYDNFEYFLAAKTSGDQAGLSARREEERCGNLRESSSCRSCQILREKWTSCCS